MSARDPLQCETMEVRTAAYLRADGIRVPAGIEFVVTTVRNDGVCMLTHVLSLADLAQLLDHMTPPTLLLRCAPEEDREALWAMIAPADPDTLLH